MNFLESQNKLEAYLKKTVDNRVKDDGVLMNRNSTIIARRCGALETMQMFALTNVEAAYNRLSESLKDGDITSIKEDINYALDLLSLVRLKE